MKPVSGGEVCSVHVSDARVLSFTAPLTDGAPEDIDEGYMPGLASHGQRLVMMLCLSVMLDIQQQWWFGLVVAHWAQSTKLLYTGPVSTEMGDQSGVQLPVQETDLST